jgi:peptide/nickel transport system permease protein
MTDTALGALPIAVSDELESPTRRALRRLFKRKGAVVGLVVIATFILLALFAPLIVPYDPIATSWSLVRKPHRSRTGSAPTISAATFSAA